MLVCLAILLSAPPALATPILPAGCNPAFQRAVVAVEESLEKGDFAGAAREVQLLPKMSLGYRWDDSKVPDNLKSLYGGARDAAMSVWTRVVPGFEIRTDSSPDLAFGFGTELSKSQGSGLPLGVASFVSETTLPRIEAIVGLKRGADLRPTNEYDIQNDVMYVIGSYLGLSDSPIPGTVMGRSDAPSLSVNRFSNNDLRVVRQNLDAVDVLRRAIHAGVRLKPAQGSAFVDPTELTVGPILQGQDAHLPVQLTNRGVGPLTYTLIADCGCVQPGPGGTLEPNQSRLVDITVDTSQFTTTIKKRVLLLTNDPDMPSRLIPIEVKVQPRYRWIIPGGDVRVVDNGPTDVNVYLDLPLDAGIFPTDVRFDGVDGTADIQPWSGMLADPANGEGPQMRSGYVVKVHVKGNIPTGRPSGTVTVTTTNQDFPEIRCSLYFQKGIIAWPDEVYLGQMAKQRKTAAFILTRPGKPFHVLSVSTSMKDLTTAVDKVGDSGDVRVTVTYDGNAQPGDFLGVIHVTTDDPRQAKIDVPVRGNVQ